MYYNVARVRADMQKPAIYLKNEFIEQPLNGILRKCVDSYKIPALMRPDGEPYSSESQNGLILLELGLEPSPTRLFEFLEKKPRYNPITFLPGLLNFQETDHARKLIKLMTPKS